MHEDRDEALIQAVLASGVHIPPMPAILGQLQALLDDDHAGPVQFARLIEQDGALSGAVYRLAGSPVFGTRTRVTRVEQAIALLGLRNTAALIRNETLRAALGDPAHARTLEALWTRTGAIAELTLRAHRQGRLRGITQDDAFTLGLFHDCGLALLIKRFPDYARALESGTWPDIRALDRANHTHHGLVGQMIARNWQLGGDIVAAIRHHHELDASGLPDPIARLCALLNFATHLHQRMHGMADDDWEAGWRVACGQRLGFDDAEMAEWEMETEALGRV